VGENGTAVEWVRSDKGIARAEGKKKDGVRKRRRKEKGHATRKGGKKGAKKDCWKREGKSREAFLQKKGRYLSKRGGG